MEVAHRRRVELCRIFAVMPAGQRAGPAAGLRTFVAAAARSHCRFAHWTGTGEAVVGQPAPARRRRSRAPGPGALPSGRRRQYSLCSDPNDTRCYRIAIRQVPGGRGGSVELHTDTCRSYLFIAGGIGITTILPMATRLAAAGGEWKLVYGRTVDVPADRTVLRTIRDVAAAVPAGCEQGICGACCTTVLAGEPDHRDELLSSADRAAGAILICVSRARSEQLVLDL